MKKIISLIIISLVSFSSVSLVFAEVEEGYIEQLLQIRTGVEGFNIERAKIDDFQFINPTIANIYTEFKKANRILKDEMMKQYDEGELTHTQINGMIINHKGFVYHTNKLFYYLSMKEKGQAYGSEIDNAITNSYIGLRSNYARLKALYNQ